MCWFGFDIIMFKQMELLSQILAVASLIALTAEAKDGSSVLFATEAFFIPIQKNLFGNVLSESDPVEYIASLSGLPDLPKWMYYRQKTNSSQAYLYGSPEKDGNVEIEIIALNGNNYDTFRHTMALTVLPRDRAATFQVEMKFSNMNVEDMFDETRTRNLLEIFSDRLWAGSENVYITLIAAPTDVGGRLPGDPKQKEGVIVRIGSTDNYTRDILDLERDAERMKNRDPCPRVYKATSAEHLFRGKDFYTDWCAFRLIRPSESKPNTESEKNKFPPPPTRLPYNIDDDDEEYKLNLERFANRDYTLDIMYCIGIPLVIGISVIVTLSCVLFSRDHYQLDASNNEINKYNSIQRASYQLRQLGKNRDEVPSSTYSTLQKPVNRQHVKFDSSTK